MANRVSLLRASAVHVSTGEGVRSHATQAWKLVVGVDCDIHVRSRVGAAAHRAILVAPYAEQSMHRDGQAVAFFVEPGAHGMPYARGSAPLALFDSRTVEALVRIARTVADGNAGDDEEGLRAALERVAPPFVPRLDRRVERALRASASERDVNLEELADRCRVSAVRLRHLVHEATGLSLRSHRLWHRTLLGLEGLLAGARVGASAHHAGFADHAHFTRAFTRFFGRSPSSLPADSALLASWADRDQAAATATGGRR
jgi:AraC family transcriptional regulator